LAFKLGDCVIFYYREFFQQLFARSGAVLSHIELTSKCQQPNHYQFTRWYALRQINNFRDLVVSPAHALIRRLGAKRGQLQFRRKATAATLIW